MTDKEFRRVNRVIKRSINKWLITMGFRRWTVTHTLYRELKEGEPDCTASCDAQWEYQNMWLKFYGPKCGSLAEKELEEVVVHELMHGLVNQMREWASDKMHHEEHVVTQLTQAIMWARWDGVQEGKRKKGK